MVLTLLFVCLTFFSVKLAHGIRDSGAATIKLQQLEYHRNLKSKELYRNWDELIRSEGEGASEEDVGKLEVLISKREKDVAIIDSQMIKSFDKLKEINRSNQEELKGSTGVAKDGGELGENVAVLDKGGKELGGGGEEEGRQGASTESQGSVGMNSEIKREEGLRLYFQFENQVLEMMHRDFLMEREFDAGEKRRLGLIANVDMGKEGVREMIERRRGLFEEKERIYDLRAVRRFKIEIRMAQYFKKLGGEEGPGIEADIRSFIQDFNSIRVKYNDIVGQIGLVSSLMTVDP